MCVLVKSNSHANQINTAFEAMHKPEPIQQESRHLRDSMLDWQVKNQLSIDIEKQLIMDMWVEAINDSDPDPAAFYKWKFTRVFINLLYQHNTFVGEKVSCRTSTVEDIFVVKLLTEKSQFETSILLHNLKTV